MNGLVFAVDDHYVLPLKVLWHSLHQTNSVPRDTKVFILHEDSLAPISCADLQAFFQVFGIVPQLIDMNNSVPCDLPIGGHDHVTRSTFYRLYISSTLPKELDSVVYLDADTIATKSIRALFNSSLGNIPIAAADHLSVHDQLRLWGVAGGSYFNAGVLIINLNQWRARNVEETFGRILQQERARIRWWDQDVLNIAFANQWGRIPIWFNSNHIVNQAVGTKAVINHARLIHYTGVRKPWNTPSPAPHELLWLKSLSELAEYYPINNLASQVPSISQVERPQIFASREDLITHCIRDGMVVAEIGVFEATLSDFICGLVDLEKFYMVDTFQGLVGSGDQDGNNFKEVNMEEMHNHLIDKYRTRHNVAIVKGKSSSFFSKLPDNALDLVYIDGDHSYNGCKADLEYAYHKVKNGGFILGHDYSLNPFKTLNVYEFGVRKAVNDFCATHGQTIFAKALDGCLSYAMRLHK